MTKDLGKMFEPFPEQGYVYGRVVSIDTKVDIQSRYYEITIDIVNQQMMKYDQNNYNEKNYDKNAKLFHECELPGLYFYYLIIKVRRLSLLRLFEERQNKRYLKYEIRQVKKELFFDYYFGHEFLALDQNREIEFIGEIYFSASPVKSNRYFVKLTKEEEDVFEAKIPDECIFNDKGLLNSKLDSLIGSISYNVSKAKVYHVGSGYYSYFEYENGERFLYDLGLNKFGEVVAYPDHGDSDLKYIILSHWDIDHFFGITLHGKDIQDKIVSKPWICPSNIVGTNASRLAFLIRLRSKGNLVVIDKDIHGVVYRNKNMSLLKGYCYSGSTSTMKNANGLTIFVENKKNFVAMGDVDYKFIDKKILPFDKTDYLVTPHHGAECEGDISIKPNGEGSLAIIPVGKNSETYKHPRKKTINDLEKIGYEVYRTDVKGPILVDLDR